MTQTSSLWVGVISLFPDMFDAITDQGVTGRAVKNGLIDFYSLIFDEILEKS